MNTKWNYIPIENVNITERSSILSCPSLHVMVQDKGMLLGEGRMKVMVRYLRVKQTTSQQELCSTCNFHLEQKVIGSHRPKEITIVSNKESEQTK